MAASTAASGGERPMTAEEGAESLERALRSKLRLCRALLDARGVRSAAAEELRVDGSQFLVQLARGEAAAHARLRREVLAHVEREDEAALFYELVSLLELARFGLSEAEEEGAHAEEGAAPPPPPASPSAPVAAAAAAAAAAAPATAAAAAARDAPPESQRCWFTAARDFKFDLDLLDAGSCAELRLALECAAAVYSSEPARALRESGIAGVARCSGVSDEFIDDVRLPRFLLADALSAADAEQCVAALAEARATRRSWPERFVLSPPLVVAVRGTALLGRAALANWLTNLSFLEHQTERGVHSGFASAARLLLPVSLFVAREAARGRRVLVAGHSLGGAIAQLVALDALRELRGTEDAASASDDEAATREARAAQRRVQCVSFGAPLVFSPELARAFEARGWRPRFVHLADEGDPVPRLLSLSRMARQVIEVVAREEKERGEAAAAAAAEGEAAEEALGRVVAAVCEILGRGELQDSERKAIEVAQRLTGNKLAEAAVAVGLNWWLSGQRPSPKMVAHLARDALAPSLLDFHPLGVYLRVAHADAEAPLRVFASERDVSLFLSSFPPLAAKGAPAPVQLIAAHRIAGPYRDAVIAHCRRVAAAPPAWAAAARHVQFEPLVPLLRCRVVSLEELPRAHCVVVCIADAPLWHSLRITSRASALTLRPHDSGVTWVRGVADNVDRVEARGAAAKVWAGLAGAGSECVVAVRGYFGTAGGAASLKRL